MKIKNEKKVFDLFVAKDDLRPFLSTPFLQTEDGRVWATDAHIMLMVEPKFVKGKYVKRDKPGLPKIDKQNCNDVYRIADIRDEYNKLSLIDEVVTKQTGKKVMCDECYGEGIVDWEYKDSDGNIHSRFDECPICEGKGEIEEVIKVPTGRRIPKYNPERIKIGGVSYEAFGVGKMLDAMDLLGVTEIRQIVRANCAPNLFDVCEGVQLLMSGALEEK